MSYNKNHPHPPTSPFQIGDRVAVTGVSAIRRPFQDRNIREGATGTVVWIAIKSGHPIVAMDEEFPGAMQHQQIPGLQKYQWCFTFQDGKYLELLNTEKIEIDTLDELL